MTKEVLEHQTAEAVPENKDDKDIKVAIPPELIKKARALINKQKPSTLSDLPARQAVVIAVQGFLESGAIIEDLKRQLKEKEKTVALYKIQDMNVEAKNLLREAISANGKALAMMEEIKLMQKKEQK